ncbi:MAG: M50 family metallopeptidase [Gammaproteobacteria bacterium]|nr:M50 family metallopeptidase [Gammaproteobacteria bacterium]
MREDLNTRKERIVILLFYAAIILLSIALIVNYIIKKEYFSILFFALSIVVSFLVSIILHELGHFIFGLISGYKFISFQVLFLALIKKNKRLKLVFEKIPAAGQCVMGVEEENKNKVKYKLYMLGGIIMNYILLLGGLIGFILILIFNGNLCYIFSGLIVVNIYLLATNAIPINVSGVYNDALNLKLMDKYESVRKAIINSLVIEYMIYNDAKAEDLPDELLNNDGFMVESFCTHSYVFDYYKSIKLLVEGDKEWFKYIDMRNLKRHELPLTYLNQNSALEVFKKMIFNETYEYLFKMKENEKFLSPKNDDFLIRVDNILYSLKKESITKEEALVKIDYFYNKEDDDDYLISKELSKKIKELAIEYIKNDNYIKQEASNYGASD